MGTSNWQNIPFCVEALMKIAPQRVLDVGVGFGRWGMIVREFCDVWYGRISKDQWSVQVVGIEAFKDNIADYHSAFYSKIHYGDAREIILKMDNSWDVVIFGDVLEHFERETGEVLLNWCLDHSQYVLVNIPLGSEWPQEEEYQNPFEKHLSEWNEIDFDRFSVCRKALFIDYVGRPFGSFILTKNDPKNLRESLFSIYSEFKFDENIHGSEKIYIQALKLKNEQLLAELNNIKFSRSNQIIEKLKGSSYANVLLKSLKYLMSDPRDELVDVPSENLDVFRPDQELKQSQAVKSDGLSVVKINPQDQKWIENQLILQRPLSINNPDWRGILASAIELFENIYPIPDNVDEKGAKYFAELFKSAKVPSITIQGFPLSYSILVKTIHKLAPEIPIYAIWHGNFLHTKEDYAWKSFQLLSILHKEGYIQKIGFVKKGMAEVMKNSGMNSYFIMNFVRRIPESASRPLNQRTNIGIWAEPDLGWKKLPYAMLASLSFIPDSVGHAYNVGPRSLEFAELLNLRVINHFDPLPHSLTIEELSHMDLNMNVSLTECAPMLPLESLSVGSPCLLGPTSHYFLDHEFLHNRLVVPYPDNANVIADYAVRAIRDREQIIEAYKQYAPEYIQLAESLLEHFLEDTPM